MACRLLAVTSLSVVSLASAAAADGQTARSSIATASATPTIETPEASYAALADLLEDRSAREKLIGQLRELADDDSIAATSEEGGQGSETSSTAPKWVSAPPSTPPRADTSVDIPTYPEGIAEFTQAFAAGLGRDLSESARVLRSVFTGRTVLAKNLERQWSTFLGFLVVLAVLVAAYTVLRSIAIRFFRRLNAWVGQAPTQAVHSNRHRHGRFGALNFEVDKLGLYRKTGGVVGALLLDAGAIVLAGLVGFLVAGTLPSSLNQGELSALGLVSAFLTVELIKTFGRAVFAKNHPKLRLWPMSDASATYWYKSLARLVSITGYGLLVVVPLVQYAVAPSVGRLVGLFIMLTMYVYAVRVIWAQRRSIRAAMMQHADAMKTTILGTLVRIFARVWHVLAIAYFSVLLAVAQIDQQEAISFMIDATIQTLVAVTVGAFVLAALSSLLTRRIRLSDEIKQRLPLLEMRLNSYVPAVIQALRLAVVLGATLVVLDAWRVFNLTYWVYSAQGKAVIAIVIRVAIILLVAASAWTIVASLIESRLNSNSGRHGPSEREKTLLSLFRNAALITIATLTILVLLSQIGIDIGPLIAGAGVVGLAVGFGAQKLVQDVITGIFIQLENGMNQNDVVELVGLFGTVEKITIRSVVLRTLDGGYHLIPFSSIDLVSNHMRGFGYHYGEYAIAYGEDVDQATEALRSAFEEFMQDPDLAKLVMEEISIPGVTSLHERGFNIRVLIKTLPGMQWEVQRGFNRLVKKHFDSAGIELPYPQSVIHYAQDTKRGHAFLKGHTEGQPSLS